MMRGLLLAITLAGAWFHNGKTGSASAKAGTPGGGGPAQIANTKSLSFDGGDDILNLGKPADLNLTVGVSTLTFSAWFKRGEAGDFERHIGGKARMGGGGQVGAVFGITADEKVETLVYGGENTSGGNIAPGGVYGWHCYSMSINGLTARLYLDGVQVGTTFTVGLGPWETTASWLIGANRGNDDTDVWYPFKGSIDEVTLWSDNFTDTQHAELCQVTHPIDPTTHSKASTLLHFYRMGDGDTYPTITDQKGSANGTCQNMAGAGSITTDVP